MSAVSGVRRLRGRKLRPLFERLLLAVSVVAGLGVVGSCAWAGGGRGARFSVFEVVVGVVVALTLIGAVFLFTTMSRDLRLLREHTLKDDAVRDARQASDAHPPGRGC